MTARAALASTRRHLDESVFLQAPRSPRVTAKRALVCGAIAIVATAIQLLRMWSSLPLESLWSEDGGIWLGDALTRDFLDALTTTHNGYLQTVSRLVAEPVAELPIEWYPAAMAIAGAAIVTGCAFLVWRTSAAHLESAYLRAGLAAMVVLLPVAGTEALANVTNSIWFLLFACFWLLLWRPASVAVAAGIGALVFLVAVTTVGILFLVPLWVLRVIAVRDRRDVVVVSALALGLAVQVGFSWNELGLAEAEKDVFDLIPAGQNFSSQPLWDWELVPAFVQRIVGGTVAGQQVNAYLWEQLGAPYAIVLAIGLFALLSAAVANPRTRFLVPIAVAMALALFLVSGYQRWGGGGSFFHWPEGESNRSGTRYLVTPALLMSSAFFVWLDAGSRGAAPRRGALQAGAAVFVLVCALASFSVGDRPTRGALPWSEALEAGRSECRETGTAEVAIQLNVAPFTGFPVPLACSELE